MAFEPKFQYQTFCFKPRLTHWCIPKLGKQSLTFVGGFYLDRKSKIQYPRGGRSNRPPYSSRPVGITYTNKIGIY